ncbi:MAG: class I SAM-dependent methyltransferase [Ignavibacteriales bacterium]
MEFSNVYEDIERAISYSKLEFPGTYYLAYRDLPEIIFEHSKGKRSIDFGCGTGRSTRFLKDQGFKAEGIDISPEMILIAKQLDPAGNYHLIENSGDGLDRFLADSYDLILSVFTFDNIPEYGTKLKIFKELRKLLNPTGIIVNLVSSPDIYVNEWASFTTVDFPENRSAKSGDKVKIIMKDVEDKRPVEDVVCSHDDYLKIYSDAGLDVISFYKPLAKGNESYQWVSETKIAPWSIYVLKRTRVPGLTARMMNSF